MIPLKCTFVGSNLSVEPTLLPLVLSLKDPAYAIIGYSCGSRREIQRIKTKLSFQTDVYLK